MQHESHEGWHDSDRYESWERRRERARLEGRTGISLTEHDPDLTRYAWYEWVMELILLPQHPAEYYRDGKLHSKR